MWPSIGVLHRFTVAILLLASFTSCLPVEAYSLYAVKDSHYVPEEWVRLGIAPANHKITVSIALEQGNPNELKRTLLEISDPSHHRYGRYMSAADVHGLLRPHRERWTDVEDWLFHHGISELAYSPGRDWITVAADVETLERLLNTKYFIYQHQTDGATAVRAPTWSLPLHLHSVIEDIQPTTSFFRGIGNAEHRPPQESILKRGEEGGNHDEPGFDQLSYYVGEAEANIDLFNIPKDITVEEVCNATVVSPLCLRVLYGTVDYVPQVPQSNQMALVNFLGEYNNRSDIDMFLNLYRPDAAIQNAAYSFSMENIAGAVNQQTQANPKQLEIGKGREGNLDAGLMLALAFPTPLTAYSTGGNPPFLPSALFPNNTNEPFLTWLQYMLAQDQLPNVISISYGESEQTVPRAYAKRVCNGFAQLGARGVSVIAVSGDYGVGKPGTCHSNDGRATKKFLPSFPGSCPWVTTVGATRDMTPERIAYDEDNTFVSGGGFSEYFDRPNYQGAEVSDYILSLEGLHKGLYNKHGRAYPDISAQGYHLISFWNGTREGLVFDGTSASAPIVASVVALVNDALIADDRPPLGFLNPWLYQSGRKAFTDVVHGSNNGCDTIGFPAKAGWDAASGFGTPWFPTFRELALQSRFRSTRPWYYKLTQWWT